MVLDGTGSVYDDTGWYLVSISWHCLVLGGTWSAKGLYACIYCKKWRFGRVTLMPHISQTAEYRANQLVYSINFKLSHAILIFMFWTCWSNNNINCMYSIKKPAQIGRVRKRYKVVPQPTTPKTYRYLGSIRKAKNLRLLLTCNNSLTTYYCALNSRISGA